MAKEDWRTLDKQALINAVGESMGHNAWTLYEASKAAYRRYKTERDEFELAMQAAFAAKLPAGMELKFGYNYGKLSIAVGPVTERAKPKAQDAGTLSDWLATQAANGDRA